MAKLVSSTYGDALFELAVEENCVDAFWQEIIGVKKTLRMNEDFMRLLNHPGIIKEEKLDLISRIFSGQVSEEIVGFLRIIVIKNHEKEIPGILDAFIHRVREYKGIGTVHVTSAVPLDDSQKKELTDKLIATTRYTAFDVDYQVDPSLLGGMVIRIGERIVDSSLKTQLQNVRRQLVSLQL